jgi:hypothetical protein
LRKEGIPFHNPYAKRRGDWNALFPGTGVSASQRLLAYLQPDQATFNQAATWWTGETLGQWASLLDSKTALVRGAKTRLEGLDPDQVHFGTLMELFQPQALADLLGVTPGDLPALAVLPTEVLPDMVQLNLKALKNYIIQSKQKSFEFPLRVAEKQGALALQATPGLYIGTGHSFKGAEFDSIYVIPDISPKMAQGYNQGTQEYESIIRLFYVMITRSKDKCTFLTPATNTFVRLGS